MAIAFYQYPKCSTCRKASKWLDEQSVDYKSINIVEKPPSKSALKNALKKSGLPLKKFFNTSGASYREGGFSEKLKTMSDAQAIEALAADGKLIKRPLLIDGDTILVGFKESDYAEKL